MHRLTRPVAPIVRLGFAAAIGGCVARPAAPEPISSASTVAGSTTTPAIAAPADHRIAAGEGHTCVLRGDESVWCWGRDSLGQSRSEAAPAAVPGLLGVRSLSAYDAANCVVTRMGLACWGDDLFGQIAMPPSRQFYPRPELRRAPDGSVDQDGVLGPQATCVLAGGRVECWGEIGSSHVPGEDSRFGPIATGEQGVNPITGWRNSPRRVVPGIDGAVQVAIGSEHLCALMPDLTVRCLGSARHGQLGRVERDLEAHHAAAPVAGLVEVVQIEAGPRATCARTASGEVHCWGSNLFAQLGVGDASKLIAARTVFPGDVDPHDRFSPVPLRVEGLPPVRQMSVGVSHVCAIGDDGRAYCWGTNEGGQLGDGSTERRATPVAMLNVEDAVDVAAGKFGPTSHTCVLLASGKVRCAGHNRRGELGRGGPELDPTPADVEGL
ncbi:RCC1 domain-containing protein [Nannocystis punicea]|uniref:Regulator of chromosome condensation (RCC1) repeat-containing protein n=1 Tax=Nannocystis punicea TaxID=2995304 RepID=A0ABY7H715_9BACT|nr:RCC1 domain-containing protein [Nannocystis poenicansa]WAS95069.1 hypothetical protein O0S08_02815 [Nannocystis poenicansa]